MSATEIASADIAAVAALEPRPLWPAMLRGFACRCPNCGKGALFGRFLKPVATCEVCGEDYTAQRADDAPPYFTMIIVGHLLVPPMVAVQLATRFSVVTYMAVCIPLIGLSAAALLQPIKGAIVAFQWAMRMHGFDRNGSEPSVELP